MDTRRLDTQHIIALGILDIPPPKTDIPHDRTPFDLHDDWDRYAGKEAVVAALERGDLVSASNYYGLPYAWKAGEGVYRGVLLQYRQVSEDKTFATADEAAEWSEQTYYATDG